MTDATAGADAAPTASTQLSGARRTAYTISKALTGLFLIGVALAFFLAGLGTYGVKGRIDDKTATASFNPHRGVGSALTLIALLLLIAVAVARPGGRTLKLAGALFVLMIVQYALAAAGTSVHVLGAFHALNGLLVLGVAGLLAVDTGALRRSR